MLMTHHYRDVYSVADWLLLDSEFSPENDNQSDMLYGPRMSYVISRGFFIRLVNSDCVSVKRKRPLLKVNFKEPFFD